MAELLYRIGRFAARRHWQVIGAWVALMAVTGLTYGLFAGTPSTAISIPGTATSQVTERLQDDFEAASGGSGSIVVETSDGAAFSDEQRAAVTQLMTDVGEVDGVQSATDPFAAQEQLAGSADQLAAGADELAQGRAALEAGQQQLDAQRAQAEAAGVPTDQLDAAQAELDAQRAELEAGEAALEAGQQVADLSSGFRLVAEDGNAAIGSVSFAEPTNEVPNEVKDAIVALADDVDVPGLEVHVSQEISEGVPSIVGPAEIVGVAIAAIVLVVMLGTALGATLPLMSALLGVGVATLGAMSLSGVVDFVSVTPVLGVMLGLAVGIDYSLFILNRHRRQLKRGVELHESIGLANGTSGNAVVFAGATVVVALLALNVTGVGFLALMGTVGAAAVVVAVLVATTFTPALLGAVGMRILRKKERAALGVGAGRHADDAAHASHLDRPDPTDDRTRTARPMSTGRAVATLVLGIVGLGVVALPALQMRLGLPDGSSAPEDSAAFQAYTTQAEQFGAGTNSPLVVVADLDAPVDDQTLVLQQAAVGQQVADVGDVAAVVPIGASTDGTAIAFQVLPEGGPNDEATADLVRELRDLDAVDATGADVTLGVAGNASANIDISQQLSDVLPVYLLVVVGLSLLILVIVFRSILVPLTATAGFVLSLLASFGGLTAIYQLGWLGGVFGVHEPGPILSFLPIIEIGILFGLAMDYQLFLVSGMREAYAHGAEPRVAVQRGLLAGRAVVTAAAIIMISVFSGFIFSHSASIKPIGFGLAFGVLVDAFVVRMLLIPAAMHLLGRSAWWLPRWLDRVLPDVDVEGARLERSHPAAREA